MKELTAITISIGDELLSGKTVDSNNAFISRQLSLMGIPVSRKLIIADDRAEIIKALDWAFDQADIITMTGGLGPTHDDITKTVLCEYFGVGLKHYPELLEQLKQRFVRRGFRFADVNASQAEYPANAELLANSRGTAQGMYFRHDGRHLFVMPGVPGEMEIITTEHIVPRLSKLVGTQIDVLDIHSIGIPESTLFEQTKPLLDQYSDIKIAYLPRGGMVTIRISVNAPVGTDNSALLNKIYAHIKGQMPEQIYGRDNEQLAGVVGRLLKQQNATVATAESCTGGLIASLITDISGSSEYFQTGYITYANATKRDLLGVSEATLSAYGAVSEQTVDEMLTGALRQSGADYAVAVSGIAGPEGGTADKPVGTVYIGVAGDKGRFISRFQFGRKRLMNKTLSAYTALNSLRLLLEGRLK